MTTTTTPAAGSQEAALSDLMAHIYEHAGRYPEDTMGELRSLPTKRDCPDWCGTVSYTHLTLPTSDLV